MPYHVYLEKTLLPIAPSKIQIKIKGQNKTMTLIDDSEINILKKSALTEIEFDVLLPQLKYPFAVYKGGFQRANYFLKKLEQLKQSGKSFQFIVVRTLPQGKSLFNTNITVSLEEYKILEDSKNGFDISVSIKLKQFKPFGTKTYKIKKKKPTVPPTPKPVRPTEPKKIVIGSNVILNGILHRDSYGNGSGQSRSNYRGKVNFINLSGSHPYHVTTPDGGWLGWVTSSSVKGV